MEWEGEAKDECCLPGCFAAYEAVLLPPACRVAAKVCGGLKPKSLYVKL